MSWEELLFLIKPIWSGSMIRGPDLLQMERQNFEKVLVDNIDLK